ncbi:MAG: hypothetical protein ACXU82_01635 [Caulobacteraceae bacterium]
MRSPAAIAIAALVGFNLYLVVALRPYFLPIDDAYITLHNARVLWTGADPNYDVGALVGATSPVHLAAVALLYPLLGSGAGIAVSFIGAALYLAGVGRLAKRMDLPLTATWVLVVAAVGSGYAVFQLVNGLETSLVLAAVTWAIVLAQDSRSRALPVLCGALPFLRPELAILATALMARQLHARWQEKALRQGMTDIALAVASALPWILWTWAQTGSVLPNTAGAKTAFFAEARLPIGVKLTWVGGAICAGLGVAVAAPLLVRPSSLAAALWGYAALFAALFVASFPGGLFHNSNRYAFALLPVALWALGDLWRSRRSVFWPLAGLLALIAPVFIVKGVAAVVSAQATSSDAFGAAAWVKKHVPAGQPVLIHDAGVISYASDARLVDVVGLKTPSSVAEHQKLTLPSVGARRAEAVDAIARRAGARYAVILDDGGFWGDIGKDLASRRWRLDLVRAPGSSKGYAIYKLTPPAP